MREGAELVVVVDNLYSGSRTNIQHHEGNSRFLFVEHDLIEPLPDSITKIEPKFSVIFHLACPASPPFYQQKPIETTMVCVNGTHQVLQLATAHQCPFLMASTSEVYGDPLEHPQRETYHGNVSCNGIRSCYDEGKRCAESLCFDFHRIHQTPIRVVRIFNTYGPRMAFNDGRIISNFLVQALTNIDITVYGTGVQTRSFQYVDDLLEGFWRFVGQDKEIGPINLGNPEEYTINEMAKMILDLVPSSTSKTVYKPCPEDDPRQRKPDIQKAKEVLGWAPQICVKEGLRRTLEDFKDRLQKS